jgi:ubiquinone biosynthesis protein
MESAVRTVCEPIFDRPLQDISFGQILLRLFEISRRFNMQVQPQLILLQKTLLNIEGLGRDLYPQLDIWQTASPILREWMRERVSVREALKDVRKQMPELLEAARALPAIMKGAVHRARGGVLRAQVDTPGLDELKAEIRRSERRRNAVTIGAALLLGGLVWLGHGVTDWRAWALVLAAAVWLLIGSRLE